MHDPARRRARSQPAPSSFTLDQVLSFRFADNLVASPPGARIAWTFIERGARNVFVADGPAFQPRRITPYVDDGQELTSVSFSADGRTTVYVRGGDRRAKWTAEGNLRPSPTSVPAASRMPVFSIDASGNASPKLLGDGDEPAIAPRAEGRLRVVADFRRRGGRRCC